MAKPNILLGVPAAPAANANSIVIQHRAHNFKGSSHEAGRYLTVPPMSMCFRKRQGTKSPLEKKTQVFNVAANIENFDSNTDVEFAGVSIEGVSGMDAVKFGEAQRRLALITRGEAVIMCRNSDVRAIGLGNSVKFTFKKDKLQQYTGFPYVALAALEACQPNDKSKIGILIRKPGKRDMSNYATVLLE